MIRKMLIVFAYGGSHARTAFLIDNPRGLGADSYDRDHKRDPAGHIPSFNFALQCVLRLKLGAAVVDCGSKPVKCLRSPEVTSNS
jgi:hypothetical protein